MSRHPKALPYLFLTEMWERFGFYVVQGMLVLYMTKAFGFSDDRSFTISGMFAALAYISPLLGGFLADKVLGFKEAIVWGGLFLIAGYALLATPFHHVFYLALATIIVGNGLFKPNVSSLLGALYKTGDSARDSGFTIFYIGINTGILLAGIGSGYIKDHFGWHAGFGLASFGLVIGILTFFLGVKKTELQHFVKQAVPYNKWLAKKFLLIYCFIAIFFINQLMQSDVLGAWFLPIVGVILVGFIFVLAVKQKSEYKKGLLTLNILILSSVVFWSLYLQMFLSVNLYIDRLVDKQIFGFTVPTTAFYALEAIFVVILGPLFAWSWMALSRVNNNPSPVLKFVLGIFFAGLGCLVLALSTYFGEAENSINAIWIVASYLCITTGELLLSPIGLSAVTILSPSHLTGMMMGIWFAALGFGGQFSGSLAKLASIPANAQTALAELPIYRHAFFDYAWIGFGVAILLLLIHLSLRKSLQE